MRVSDNHVCMIMLYKETKRNVFSVDRVLVKKEVLFGCDHEIHVKCHTHPTS